MTLVQTILLGLKFPKKFSQFRDLLPWPVNDVVNNIRNIENSASDF
ncbi:hypothetical protein NW739_01035 [Mycoplasmopsis felis]|nr:hypothetical protein [Mycoplasmopsis felis]MCU9939410.1 hypothetical protein [Mycoplasmopsis felis]